MKILFGFVMLALVAATGCKTNKCEPHNIELPRTAVEPLESSEAGFTIYVLKDGRLFLGSEAVTPDKLKEELRVLISKDPGTRVVVYAEEEVPFKEVVEAMDLAKLAGVEKLSIATVKNNKPVVMEAPK